jgi:tetratricopeptide (TPR) repeat protein
MKKLILSIILLGALTQAHAQKTEVAEAKKQWSLYEFTNVNLSFGKKMTALNSGLAHTDNAIANEKSKDLLEAWIYRSLFASAIAVTDTTDLNNSIAKQKIAEEAIAKAKTLDIKGNEKDNIENSQKNVRNSILVRGSVSYNRKDYALALSSFEQLLVLNPKDTSMYVNAGVTAKMLKKYPEAIGHFKKVIELNSPMSRDLYSEITAMLMNNMQDTVGAMKLMDEALVKFPDDTDFIGMQTDIYIKNGNIEKSQELLNKLIAKDSKRAVYHFLLGETYYKQALNMQDTRKKIDAKKVKEFDAITAKMTAFIDQAIPFYKKTLDLDANFVPALESLKQIYGFKNDETNFMAIKKRLDAIPQQ